MNDFDLERKLKSVPVPEQTDEYWEDFPSRVRMQLARPARIEQARRRRGLTLAWNGGLALACLLLFFSLLPVFHLAFNDDHLLRRDTERFSLGMHILMADGHGMQNLVVDSE